jgi:hypothetical protein
MNNYEKHFTEVYLNNLWCWDGAESKSGYGTDLKNTENIRIQIPKLFEEFNIKTIFDASCGDFYWMKHIVQNTTINYIGGDIVEPMINDLNLQYSNNRIKFIKHDITENAFPKADLWICRATFTILPFNRILKALKNFINSEIPYALITNHNDGGVNIDFRDFAYGTLRKVRLCENPFSLPREPLKIIQDHIIYLDDVFCPNNMNIIEIDKERDLYLWSREQISYAIQNMNVAEWYSSQ